MCVILTPSCSTSNLASCSCAEVGNGGWLKYLNSCTHMDTRTKGLQSREPRTSSGSPIWVQGPKDLGQLLLLLAQNLSGQELNQPRM